jgi:hypothetical protein
MDETARKDEAIAALTEMVQKLQNDILNLRIEAGLKLKEKDAAIVKLTDKLEELGNKFKSTNGQDHAPPPVIADTVVDHAR